MEKEKTLPEKKFRAGAISATIWKNKTQQKGNGPSEYRTISLERVYKDKEGTWQNTRSLRILDIPKALLVLNKAYEYLVISDSDEMVEVEEVQ
ncbi:MAG: hypothetical protein NTV63_05870 [Candidatus Woesearchaeota archaeon]|nr:hypothetical protein [Candidatus Woesearchaeota archaeon]